MYSLDDSLQVILPHLSSALVSREALPHIRHLTRLLPPVHWGGFECRLDRASQQIDFHQGIENKDHALSTLENHTLATTIVDHSTWIAIQRFCTILRLPSPPLHGKITRIVLEFDDCHLPSDTRTPSLFLGLDRNLSAEQFSVLVKTTLAFFGKQSPGIKFINNLRLCLNARSNGVYISDLGMMLSRDQDVVRVNIAGLSRMQILNYLSNINWPGSTSDMEVTLMPLLEYVDYVVLCLDIGADIHPTIGVECFFKRSPGKTPRWTVFLDHLIARGLCTAAKRDALMAWPGYSDPTISEASWPGDLIIASILQANQTFSIISREVSHFKINQQLNCPFQAKGYIGFQHTWAK